MSEFGRGFAYCLGLFLAHAEKDYGMVAHYDLWFCAATDHLWEYAKQSLISF